MTQIGGLLHTTAVFPIMNAIDSLVAGRRPTFGDVAGGLDVVLRMDADSPGQRPQVNSDAVGYLTSTRASTTTTYDAGMRRSSCVSWV
jgi:hypothetical protein